MLTKIKVIAGLLLTLSVCYQLLSPNGLGAKWGVPSYDTFFKEPREILRVRVASASVAQQEVADEFTSALEKFKSVTAFQGGDLEQKFNTLNHAFERSEAAAKDVSDSVDAVVSASDRMLDEWRDELEQYHNKSLKRKAQLQFDATRSQSETLIAAMRKAEAKVDPVLGAFRDQVLFMKHNLNMQAISSLQQETQMVEQEVSALIREMERSIAEAKLFMKALNES